MITDPIKKVLSCGLVAVISMSSFGCAVRCYPPGRECNQRQANLNQTTAEGALIGAALGLGVAALIKPNRLATGALVGLLAGGVAGNMVGQRQDYYYSRKTALEREIRELQSQNAALAAYNRDLTVEIERLESRIKELKRTVANAWEQRRRVDYEKRALEQHLSGDRNRIYQLRRNIEQYSNEYAIYQRRGIQVPEIENELNGLHASLNEYDRLWQRLVSI